MHGTALEPVPETKGVNISHVLVAVLECLLLSTVYVGLLYVWTGSGPRNDPSTIKRRMISVLLTCSISWVPASFHSANKANISSLQSAQVTLGLTFNAKALTSTAVAVIHTSTLFLLPLIYKLRNNATSVAAALHRWTSDILTATKQGAPLRIYQVLARPFEDNNLWLWRNLVIAPFTEEFVFRACMAPLLLNAGVRVRTVVFTLPLFFGAAHLHHLRDLIRHQGARWVQACLVVFLQFTYTTVFGWYAAWLFIQSGSVWPPVLCHALCNWIQLPDFPGMARTVGGFIVLLGTSLSVWSFIWSWSHVASLFQSNRSEL